MSIEAIATVAGTAITAGTAIVLYITLLTKAQLGTILVKIKGVENAIREQREEKQVLTDKVQKLQIDVTRITERMKACAACRKLNEQPED